MGTKRISQVSDYVVPLSDIKLHLHVDGTAEDTTIGDYVKSALDDLEKATGRCYLTSTFIKTIDNFANGEIVLDNPPVVSVASIQYVDTAGVQHTLPVSDYVLDNSSDYYATLTPAYGETWPATRDQKNAVTITYAAGYTVSTVPPTAKQAIRYMVGNYYANRENTVTGTITSDIPAYEGLINSLKCWEVL